MREVSSEQFQQITDLLRQSVAKRKSARNRHLTLAQKLARQREARELMDRARNIGQEKT
jgi:hypothetical protein